MSHACGHDFLFVTPIPRNYPFVWGGFDLPCYNILILF